MKFPKYLVEMDRAECDPDTGLPGTAIWVARLRDPFALGLVSLGAAIQIQLWPPIIDANRASLADKIARALFREYDLDPGDWAAPEIGPMPETPPEFIIMVRPGSESEFVLEPHAPRLWRLDQFGAEWWRGFGLEPEFPRDTRRVAEFLRT